MKNFIRILVVAIFVASLPSCVTPQNSSATFALGTSFEIPESEIASLSTDSTMYAPVLSWDQIMAFNTQADGTNIGYQGGFKLSAKKGSPEDSDAQAIFCSADPGAGASESNCYLAFRQTPTMPSFDITFDYSAYITASSSVVGCYVCNSECTRRMAESGGFQQGDYLKVVMEFFRGGQFIGSLDKYLVDYSPGRDAVMVNEWEIWDMGTQSNGSIASFDAIKIMIETSRPEIEPCFCLDSFVVQLSVEY